MAGKGGGFGADPFHDVAIADKSKDFAVEEFMLFCVEFVGEKFESQRLSNGIARSLT